MREDSVTRLSYFHGPILDCLTCVFAVGNQVLMVYRSGWTAYISCSSKEEAAKVHDAFARQFDTIKSVDLTKEEPEP